MNVTPYLYIIAGPLKGSKIRLRPSLTLGRKKANINLKDSKVSSLHAQISRDTEGQWCIEDMGSRNGIYQNGIRYKKVILKEKKPIFIGDNLFVLKYKPTKKKTIIRGRPKAKISPGPSASTMGKEAAKILQ